MNEHYDAHIADYRSNTGNAFTGSGLYNGAAGTQSVAGIRGVHYTGENNTVNELLSDSSGVNYGKIREPFNPMVRTCKPNKKLVR